MGNVSVYTLIDYFDVWGNEDDGWVVNNQAPVFRDLCITDDATDEEILNYLVIAGFLAREGLEKLSIEDTGDGIMEIVETETGYPVGRLERNNTAQSAEGCKFRKHTVAGT